MAIRLGWICDGPANNKALYAITPVTSHMSIRQENVISWLAISDKSGDKRGAGLRLGFMSQVSPNGECVVTTVNTQMYVANFADYRFLQVFYPTRGTLAWYNRSTGRMQALPGAADPRYVHTGATWSPDGKVSGLLPRRGQRGISRRREDGRICERSERDPDPVRPLSDPLQCGARAGGETDRGSFANSMSNTFPKVSPDGRWIVFVQCRNGSVDAPRWPAYIIPQKAASRAGCDAICHG